MKTKNRLLLTLLLATVLLMYIYNLLPAVISWGPGPNYKNVSVRTTVNITDAMPIVYNVTCTNSTSSIILTAGLTQTVSCLVQILDYNGGNTIWTVNGTFYYSQNYSSNPDDNNTHYTNESCTENTTNGWYANWTCTFDVLYYANNGTWKMTAIVRDNSTYNTSRHYVVNGTGNTTIAPLYALNVTPVINFGDLAVGEGDLVDPIQANVTNFGNMNINVSVYGYGGDNQTLGANYAMLCEVRNLTLANERYSINPATAYGAMTPITGSRVHITGLLVPQQIDDLNQVINTTYWRIYVNETINPFGVCNGTVVFSAEAP